jgi:hypothetical protein
MLCVWISCAHFSAARDSDLSEGVFRLEQKGDRFG